MRSLCWLVMVLMIVQQSYQKEYKCDQKAKCGCSKTPASITRIVGGENAKAGSWGWAVSIQIKKGGLCGGSVLSSTWIITAAHCMVNVKASEVVVFAGSDTLWTKAQQKKASKVIVHEQYNKQTQTNDIALIQLASPLKLGDSVSAICLPPDASKGTWPEAKTSVVAVGWGRTTEGGKTSKKLQQVTLEVMDPQAKECSRYARNKKVQLCATVSDFSKDTCQGDSGGPLMVFTSKKQWVLAGLTSFGEGCAKKGSPGVYTRVASLKSWIKKYVNVKHSDSRGFADSTDGQTDATDQPGSTGKPGATDKPGSTGKPNSSKRPHNASGKNIFGNNYYIIFYTFLLFAFQIAHRLAA